MPHSPAVVDDGDVVTTAPGGNGEVGAIRDLRKDVELLQSRIEVLKDVSEQRNLRVSEYIRVLRADRDRLAADNEQQADLIHQLEHDNAQMLAHIQQMNAVYGPLPAPPPSAGGGGVDGADSQSTTSSSYSASSLSPPTTSSKLSSASAAAPPTKSTVTADSPTTMARKELDRLRENSITPPPEQQQQRAVMT